MARHRLRPAVAFAILFVAYQAPEGVGSHLLGSFAVQAVLVLAFLPIAYAVGRWLGRGFDAYALFRHPGWARNLACAFLLSVAAKGVAVAAGTAAGLYVIGPPATPKAGSALVLAMLSVLGTTFFPSIAEDIVARGFWYRTSPKLPAISFVLLSAGYFVLNHIYRLGKGPLEWTMLFAFGLAYAAALARTGSLWAALGLHWGWNFAGLFLDSVVNVEPVLPWTAPLVSTVTHLVVLAVVVRVPAWLVAAPHRAAPPLR